MRILRTVGAININVYKGWTGNINKKISLVRKVLGPEKTTAQAARWMVANTQAPWQRQWRWGTVETWRVPAHPKAEGPQLWLCGEYKPFASLSNKNLKSKFLHENLLILKLLHWASLVAQWLRICLPMQGTRVRALVWEDPTCRGATGPLSHNYWACASGACSPQQQRPR